MFAMRLTPIIAVLAFFAPGAIVLADRPLDPLRETDHAVKLLVPPGKTIAVQVEFPALRVQPERDVSIYDSDRNRVRIFNNRNNGSGTWSWTNSSGQSREVWIVGRYKINDERGRDLDWRDCRGFPESKTDSSWKGAFSFEFDEAHGHSEDVTGGSDIKTTILHHYYKVADVKARID